MKKILISVFAMALALPVFAQPAEGQFTAGGSLGFNLTNTFGKYDGDIQGDGEKTRSFSITPEFGYMLTDSWQLGLALSYDYSRGEMYFPIHDEFGNAKQSLIGVGVFARKFFPISDKLSFAVLGGAGVQFGSQDLLESIPNVNAKLKNFGFGVEVAPEFWFHLTPCTSLTAQLGNMSYFNATITADADDKAKINTSGFDMNWNAIQLGVNFAF